MYDNVGRTGGQCFLQNVPGNRAIIGGRSGLRWLAFRGGGWCKQWAPDLRQQRVSWFLNVAGKSVSLVSRKVGGKEDIRGREEGKGWIKMMNERSKEETIRGRKDDKQKRGGQE